MNPLLPDGQALELLFESPDLPRFPLPDALAACYGGALGFSQPRLYANFVASVDGVVALREGTNSGSVISGHSAADRFVMALLRACAGAVLVGAGTFRATPGHLWHAGQVYPAGAALFAELRGRLGLAPEPLLVLISASGNLDPSHPALRHPTLVATTSEGAARLRGRLPEQTQVAALADGPISMAAVLSALHERGHRLVLTEGGPTLVGQLIAEGLLDELFLTTAPSLFGRTANDGRKTLVEDVDISGSALALLSARRHGSFLFLRYALSHALRAT